MKGVFVLLDIARKQALWNAGLPSILKKCSKTMYKMAYNLPLTKFDLSVEVAEAYQNSVMPDDWKDAYKICQSHNAKVRRIGNRLKGMFQVDKYNDGFKMLFLTLTFTDDVLANTSQKTRRTYVARYLKGLPNNIDFTANIDFGDENGREHYHANVLAYGNIDLTAWKYGIINCETIHVKNEKALSKYLCKFKFHATKDSTNNQRIIYKRNAWKDYPTMTDKQRFDTRIKQIVEHRARPCALDPVF
jgi:hypothetical protein